MKRRELFVTLALSALSTLLPGQLSAQSMQLEVIELHTRTADEVIPVLEPMLVRGGTISGLKDKLVIRTTPANLAELRKILDVVDARPRRLLITVRQDADVLRDEQDIELSTSIARGPVRVEVPGSSASSNAGAEIEARDATNRVRTRVRSTQLDHSRQSLQTVQVLEGNTAFISIGESLPIKDRSTAIGVGGVVTSESTTIRDIASGFYATPRMNGDTVTVQLSASADTLMDRDTGAARIQRVTSVISGKIGTWMEVGGISSHVDRQKSRTISHSSNLSRDQKRTYIKVEEIH